MPCLPNAQMGNTAEVFLQVIDDNLTAEAEKVPQSTR